jgi:mono/diheme cytochrome c family protein
VGHFRGAWLAFTLATLAGACGDPVRDAVADSLGPERGVRPGPEHRPGQPCLACHTDGGRAGPSFSVAGTLYRAKDDLTPLAGAEVRITDSAGRAFRMRSNCAGNFYMRPSEGIPAGPYWITLAYGDYTIEMETPVYREGSCATCHTGSVGPLSAGPVFMTDEPDEAAILAELPSCRD